MKKTLVTAALPYANGKLHIGHMGGVYVPACVFSRYRRLVGDDLFFVCGSDEYGTAITLSAEMAGRSYKEHVDLFDAMNQKLFNKLQISFDFYSRTTWEGHIACVQEFFLDLLTNGYLEEREEEQLYSVVDRKFLADRYVVGTCPKCGFEAARGDECTKCAASYEAIDLISPRSKLTGSTLEKKNTSHFYMKYDLFKERLEAFLEGKDWKENVLEFARNYLKDLRARPITRDLEWGVPVPLPGYEGKVIYVWFDAPIGYISASRHWAKTIGKPEEWEKYWFDPKTNFYQFLGKDNITFHALLFPAMIMGQKKPYKLVDELIASEFLNLEGRKISKSDGWYFDLDEAIDSYGSDAMRYALCALCPETKDADFTWELFAGKVNQDLVGKLGNFAHRLLHFIYTRRGGKVTKGECQPLLGIGSLSKIQSAYDKCSVRLATSELMEFVAIGNRFIDAKQPWKLIREENSEIESVLYEATVHLMQVALAASPIIPFAAQKIWEMLGLEGKLEEKNWSEVANFFPDFFSIQEPKTLFTPIEAEQIAKETEKLKVKMEVVEEKSEITIDDFVKVTLQVCQILSVEPVPKSKKLLRFEVDLGNEKRQVVSGIAQSYPDREVLIGKKVILVSNLKKATLMGVESHGMLLCGDDAAGAPVLIEAPCAQCGCRIR